MGLEEERAIVLAVGRRGGVTPLLLRSVEGVEQLLDCQHRADSFRSWVGVLDLLLVEM